jgi:hypothetical protein
MARIFIHHDAAGNVLAVAKVDGLAEGLEHPFHVTDAEHGVVEIDPDDPAHGGDLTDLLTRQIKPKAPRKKKPR